jgi:hypothetical protein
MQPDSYAGEGRSALSKVAMVQRAIATLDVAESPQLQLLKGAWSRVLVRTSMKKGRCRCGFATCGRGARSDFRSRSRSSQIEGVWTCGLVDVSVEWAACGRGTHAHWQASNAGRWQVREVRGQRSGQRCGRGGIASIIITITIKLAAEREGKEGTCPGCRRKGYKAKI